MPTISQLPAVSQVTAADEIPISQSGAACSVSVGTLLAGTQPAIMAATGNLLGRTSLGPGGPESIEVGIGLLLSSETLLATGADHASFPVQGTLTVTDDAVLNSSGNPKRLQLSALRGLFSAGSNVSIDQYGTISASLAGVASGTTSAYSITSLPTVTAISETDLVAISQGGSDHTVAYTNFINGQTIDQVEAAAPASGTDMLLVAQEGNLLARQTLAAVWDWLSSELASYQPPTLELTIDTTLSAAAHNGRVLICSSPITVTPAATNMGNGFACDLLNVSADNVILAAGFTTSTGTSVLGPGQIANLTCVTYSGGTLVYAWLSASPSSSGAPGQVNDVTASSLTADSITLAWATSVPPPTSYTVQYRISGTAGWSTAPSVTAPGSIVTNLLSATSYDFVVSATNSAGVGVPSAIVTASTSAGISAPGQVTSLVTSNPTASGMSLTWSAPASGGTASSYTVEYRISGTTTWSMGASGLTMAAFTVTGLASNTSYDFEVLAVNTAGVGPASAVQSATTTSSGMSVTSITWNVTPSGTYAHSNGAIGINAQVSPSNAPVQFGFSTSPTVPPTSWTLGSYVNTNLWGAYVNTPAIVGTWYAWAEGTNGSLPTVYASGFLVT